MTKRFLSLVIVGLMLVGVAVSAKAEQRIENGSTIYADRYLFFATDGGSNIDFLKLPYGTKVDLNNYVPEKVGYEFLGWYDSPREKENRFTEIILCENTVVCAKWKLIDGLSEQMLEQEILARIVIGNNVVFQTVNGEIKIVPVTDLWAERNARLEGLMKIYNSNFAQ